MFCAKCGNELRPGVSFCQVCGAKARWERVAGNHGQGTPAQGAQGYGMPAQGTPAQWNTGYGAPAQGAPAQNMPRYGMPYGAPPTGIGPAQRPMAGAAARASSQAGSDFAIRIAEGLISCLSIILVLTMPVVAFKVTLFVPITTQLTAIDLLQGLTDAKEMLGSLMGYSASSSPSYGGNPFGMSGAHFVADSCVMPAIGSPYGAPNSSAGSSASMEQLLSTLSVAGAIFGVVLVVTIVCSAITAYLCFAKSSGKRYPTSWSMVVYAFFLIMTFVGCRSALMGMLAEVSSGSMAEISQAISMEMGLGIWAPLIGGIACVVLDFMRASKANQFPGAYRPPMA